MIKKLTLKMLVDHRSGSGGCMDKWMGVKTGLGDCLAQSKKNYHCVLQISQNTYLKTKSFHCCEIEEGGGD